MLILTAARPRPGSSTGATVSSTAIIVPRSDAASGRVAWAVHHLVAFSYRRRNSPSVAGKVPSSDVENGSTPNWSSSRATSTAKRRELSPQFDKAVSPFNGTSAFSSRGRWFCANHPGLTRAYPPAWFSGKLVSLATRWDELNANVQASGQSSAFRKSQWLLST